MSTKLLFLAGSCRKGSLNMKLARAAEQIAKNQSAETTFIDLADYDLPIYNGDYEDEHGVPDNAKKLKQIFMDHDGFFIASPEYNSGYSPLLKNTIDWMTRPMGDDVPGLAAFTGKVGAISATSPGALGGIRGLVQVRILLGNINVHLIPAQVAISNGGNAFDDDNSLKNDDQKKMLHNVVEQFVSTAKSMK
jgi:NAD(P)H-dependent FMN reductase